MNQEFSKLRSVSPSFPKTISQIVGLVTEAEAVAVIVVQRGGLVGAEVVAAMRAETENLFAHHEEIVGIVRSAAIVTAEMIAAEIVVNEMIDDADQAETAMTVETVHVLVLEIATEGAASALAAEVVAVNDETETETEIVLEHPVLRIETPLQSRPGSKQKSRNESKKPRNILLLKKRLRKKACRFRGGLIGDEILLPRRDIGTMIESLARLRCADETLLVIEIGTVRDRLELEVDLAHLRANGRPESRDLRVL